MIQVEGKYELTNGIIQRTKDAIENTKKKMTENMILTALLM